MNFVRSSESIIPSYRKREQLETDMEEAGAFNEKGYNKDGYDKDGKWWYGKDGYDKDGYDANGYDKDGYDANGYNENGVHISDEPDKTVITEYEEGLEEGLDLLETPKDFYIKNESGPDSLVRKQVIDELGNVRNYLWNPVTNRWILDTGGNMVSIRKQKTKSDVRHEASPQYPIEKMRIVAPKYKQAYVNTPEAPSGLINNEYCKDNFSKNAIIDLNLVKQAPGGLEGIIGSYNKIRIENVPCLFEYKGVKLNVVEYISRGSFGNVLRYSNETPLPPGWQAIESNSGRGIYYRKRYGGLDESGDDRGGVWKRPRREGDKYFELAVKTYKNQYDDEIPLILDIETRGDEGGDIKPGFCNTLNAKILEVVNSHTNRPEFLSLMDLMDGTLGDLIRTGTLKMSDSIMIIKEVIKSFMCLKPRYGYTDLKSANVLFKCYKGSSERGKIKIVLGDIGSICSNDGGPATYPPPEAMEDPGDAPCTEELMVWDIGVLFLELIGYDTVPWFYHSGSIINQSLNHSNPIGVYLYNLIQMENNELDKIISTYNLNNIVIDGPAQNIGNLLKSIFSKEYDRPKLNYVLNSFENAQL